MRFGKSGKDIDTGEIDELTYLIEPGSDRIGALDFQRSAESYVPREASAASLAELQAAIMLVEQGKPLPIEPSCMELDRRRPTENDDYREYSKIYRQAFIAERPL